MSYMQERSYTRRRSATRNTGFRQLTGCAQSASTRSAPASAHCTQWERRSFTYCCSAYGPSQSCF